MGRYIAADKIVLTAERGKSVDGLIFIPMIDAYRSIDATPTANVTEVKHGEYHSTRFTDGVFYQKQCSICGEWTYEYDKNYCPHCGAKMDRERKEI